MSNGSAEQAALDPGNPTGRSRSIFSRAVPISLFVIVFGGWYLLEAFFTPMSIPPASVDTYEEWVDWNPQASQFVELEGDPTHLMALGPPIGFTPSGPSAYVFDRSGQLVDQAREIGESTEFEEKWRVSYPLKTISRKNADMWFEK